jgi:hypothetical protein
MDAEKPMQAMMNRNRAKEALVNTPGAMEASIRRSRLMLKPDAELTPEERAFLAEPSTTQE